MIVKTRWHVELVHVNYVCLFRMLCFLFCYGVSSRENQQHSHLKTFENQHIHLLTPVREFQAFGQICIQLLLKLLQICRNSWYLLLVWIIESAVIKRILYCQCIFQMGTQKQCCDSVYKIIKVVLYQYTFFFSVYIVSRKMILWNLIKRKSAYFLIFLFVLYLHYFKNHSLYQKIMYTDSVDLPHIWLQWNSSCSLANFTCHNSHSLFTSLITYTILKLHSKVNSLGLYNIQGRVLIISKIVVELF